MLQEVQDILDPPILVDEKTPILWKADSEHERTSNRFSKLTLSEPSQAFLDAPDIQLEPSRPPTNTPKYLIHPEDSDEEAMFMLATLLDDLMLARKGIDTIWAGVLTGETESASAAVATDTALELCRNMSQEMETMFDRYGGLGRLFQKTMEIQYSGEQSHTNDTTAGFD